jgi:hypothetical protein
MKIQYLEIVTPDAEVQSKLYEKLHGTTFSGPVAELGNAFVAEQADGSRIGFRPPMHETEEPVVRPYFLTEDIEGDVKQLEKNGAEIIHQPLEIPGIGTFAIYILGGVQQALWQV